MNWFLDFLNFIVILPDKKLMAVGLRPLWSGSLIRGRCNGEHRPSLFCKVRPLGKSHICMV